MARQIGQSPQAQDPICVIYLSRVPGLARRLRRRVEVKYYYDKAAVTALKVFLS